MILTEEEAKTKWCPFARMMHGDEGAYNRDWRDISSTECLGSQCMAWRWEDPYNLTNAPESMRHGYCGLSRKAVV